MPSHANQRHPRRSRRNMQIVFTILLVAIVLAVIVGLLVLMNQPAIEGR